MGLDEINNSAYVLSADQQKRVNSICERYIEEIVPLLTNLEIIDLEYPIEITNEIRAIFTHLSRCYTYPTRVDIDAQITGAERHVKRALLDCYKYTCLSHADYIKQFKNDYRGIDLTLIDYGQFVSVLRQKTTSAQEKIEQAKKTDTCNIVLKNDLDLRTDDPLYPDYCRSICDDQLFLLYQEAYVEYSECVEFIKSNQDKVDFYFDKAESDQITNHRSLIAVIVGAILGGIGLLIGIIGLIVGIISLTS